MPVSLPLLLLLLVPFARATLPSTGSFGIGLAISNAVSGLSMKYYSSRPTALQFTFGVWGDDRHDDEEEGDLGICGDFLLEQPVFAATTDLEIAWNLGPGLWAAVSDETGTLGVSGVIGIEFLIKPIPMDFVLEYRPGLAVVPDPDPDLANVAGHIRYYF